MKFKVPSYFCILVLIKHASSAEVFAQLYSSTYLPCSAPLTELGKEKLYNLSLLRLNWFHNGSVIAASGAPGNHTEQGFSLQPGALENGTFSLMLHNVSHHHQGNYMCRFVYNCTDIYTSNVTLTVIDIPTVTISIPSAPSPLVPLTLSCEVEAYYRGEVSITWLQNGALLPKTHSAKPSSRGTLITSYFRTLSPEERKKAGVVHCVVHHSLISDSVFAGVDLAALNLNVRNATITKSAKASVALMVLSLIMISLLGFGFSWRRREEKLKSLNVSSIILPHRLMAGQKSRAIVSVEGRRVDRVYASWFLNDTALSASAKLGSKEDPLLTHSGKIAFYKIHTERPLQSVKGKQQLLSTLTFIPNINAHKGSVLKCQISYLGKDKIVVEKVSEKLTPLALPEVSDIRISEPHDDTGDVTLRVEASRFHPDIITFRWFCQGGELSPIAPSPFLSEPQPGPQGLFSALSQCRLPCAELEKGETKVWVTVHHVALKQPIIRETRGFLKRPVVSDIASCPSESPNQPLSLGCEITGFYPPDILVTWWKHEKGTCTELLERATLWGPLWTEPRTYRATAMLSEGWSETDSREVETSILCRVMHCSLQEPIEKVFYSSSLAPPSIPAAISAEWSTGEICVLSLRLRGGTPKPQITWAAGNTTLIPLVSVESEEEAKESGWGMESMCTLQKLTTQTERCPVEHTFCKRDVKQVGGRRHDKRIRRNSRLCLRADLEIMHRKPDNTIKTDKKFPGTPVVRRTRVRGEEEDEKKKERKNDRESNLPYINIVKPRLGQGQEPLRVTVEVKHPALPLPVYRTWTETPQE